LGRHRHQYNEFGLIAKPERIGRATNVFALRLPTFRTSRWNGALRKTGTARRIVRLSRRRDGWDSSGAER
jgi:hypothetical protein